MAESAQWVVSRRPFVHTRWFVLGIAVVVLAGVGAVYPDWRRKNLLANEQAAIARLRFLWQEQARLQQAGAEHADGNVGIVHAGRRTFAGYVFEVFQSAEDGSWGAANEPITAAARSVGALRAARRWVCYAWPEEPGVSGRRAFLVNAGGDVFARRDASQPGLAEPRLGTSGFVRSDGGWRPAANEPDVHGETWVVVG